MPQCAFKNCVNNHRNTKVMEGISFFRFPSDPFRCAEWVSIVAKERGEEIYNPYKNSKICSIHFDRFDITGNTQRRRLLKTAVPKLQIHGPIKMQSAISSELTKDLSNQATSSGTLNFKNTMEISDVPRADAVGFESSHHASLSDLISVCDTPRKSFPRDPVRCEEWRSIIARQRSEESIFKPNQGSVICSNHFSESDKYVTLRDITRLHKTDVPRIEANDLGVNDESSFDQKANEQSCLQSEIKIEPRVGAESPTSSLSIGSILDTPKETFMKKKLLTCKRLIKVKNDKLSNLRKKFIRLKKKCNKLKDIVSKLKKRQKVDKSLIPDLSKHKGVTDIFNAICLKNRKRRKRPFSQYPPGAKKFAITLHLYSPAAYNYMRKMFDSCLPHPSTLCNWYRSMNSKPGFRIEAFDRLKEEADEAEKETK